MVFNDSSDTRIGDLAYDLRQTYAKIVGEHLEDVSVARKASDFYGWFKNLEDLHTVTHFKFKKKDIAKTEYTNLKTVVINLANKYASTWTGTNKIPNEVMELENALRDLENWLWTKIEEAKILGESFRVPGL